MKPHTGLDFADMMVEQHGDKALEVALETVRQVHVRRLRQTASFRSPLRVVAETEGQRRIIEAVCDRFGLSKPDLFQRGRPRGVCHARQVCWALLRDRQRLSFVDIGLLFERHHTTISSGVDDPEARGVDYQVITADLDGLQRAS
jgi:chromosomal replication initiation ATPase DnaA